MLDWSDTLQILKYLERVYFSTVFAQFTERRVKVRQTIKENTVK